MEDFIEEFIVGALFDTFGGAISMIGLVILLFNALQCFLGYKLFKIWVSICSFAIGFLIGLLGGVAGGNPGTGVVFGILLGVLFAWLGMKFYYVGVFVMAALLTFGGGMLLCGSWALSLVAAVVVGVIAVKFTRIVLIISSAVSGGMGCGLGFALLILQPHAVFIILFGLLFAAAGIYVQFKTNAQNAVAVQAAVSAQGITIFPSVAPALETAHPMPPAQASMLSAGAAAIPKAASKKTVELATSYYPGWPVAVKCMKLFIAEDMVEFSALFCNQSGKGIKSIYCTLHAFDDTNEPVGEAILFPLMDVNMPDGRDFGSEKVLRMPAVTVRDVKLVLDKVSFADGDVWKNNGEEPVALQKQEEIDKSVARVMMVADNLISLKFIPIQGTEHWQCVCGVPNSAARETCVSCKQEKQKLFEKANAQIVHEKALLVAEECRRVEEEEKKREEERKKREEEERLEAEKRRAEEERQKELARQRRREKVKAMAQKSAELVKSGVTVAVNKSADLMKTGVSAVADALAERAEKNSAFCENCGAKLVGNARFCWKCGVRIPELTEQPAKPALQAADLEISPVLQAAPVFCENCGAELEDDAPFCGNCGYRVAETKEEVTL